MDGSFSAGDPELLNVEWSMSIRPDATVVILHNGVAVVKAQHITWVENSKWGETRFQAEYIGKGQATLSGEIPGLGLKAQGSIHPIADNKLGVDYQFTASTPHYGIYGTVLDWKFDLRSPTFKGKVADPIFLENQTGWSWQVGSNQVITVRFDQPLDRIIYEANNKNNIRTFSFAGQVKPGTRRVSYAVELPEGGQVVPAAEERYGSTNTTHWFRDAFAWNGSPIDLSFLNAQERPAGRHGILKAQGDGFVFEDGTSMRFWAPTWLPRPSSPLLGRTWHPRRAACPSSAST